MTIQEILQEIKKIADNNSFVNFSYIGDVEEMKLQPGFEYPGFAVQNYSYDEETKTYYLSLYLISEDRTLENDCLNVLKDIVYNINLKHLDLGIVIKSDNIQLILAGNLNGAYCSMQLQMTLTSCVCEDKPGYVSSVNGQTGDVILDIPDIKRTVIDVNGQIGHVVLDIPEKLSDLYQDIEYATPDFVDEKVTAEHNYTDSVKSNLEDKIGKLVTGVSSVNGSTGDVVIFIPKMTSDLENDSAFIDSEYVDNLIEALNSSVNTNYAKKSELNKAISDEVSRADNKYANKTDIPTDFYTKQEVDNKDKNIIANTSLNFATKTQLNTAIANEVSRADNKYANKTDIPTNVYTKKEVDDKDKNIIANTSLNFATKTQLNTAISDEVSRADNAYAKKTDIPTDFYTKQEVDNKVSTKQDVLVSGTNIKTINGKDILGSGDVTIESGTDEAKVKEIIYSEMSTLYLPEIVNSVENLDNQIIANASINYLLKTDYIAPDVNKEYVDTEIGKLVTGVSSVNGMTGDVTIETVDTKYVDDKFDTLNSSVNANFQVKGDYATNERVNNVEALIPTDVVEHAEIADFVTNSSITENYYKKSEVDNKIETLDSSVSENYVKKGEIPQDVYSKTEVDNLFTEYNETVDSTYEKKGHYDNKISEIDSSIGDISTRLAGIKVPTDYVKTADYSADKEAQATKDSEQDSNIATANLNISQVDAKVDNINSSTAEAFGTVTGQMSNVSGRVLTIEDDYVKHNEIEHFVTDSFVSVNYATKEELNSSLANVSSWVNNNFARKSSLDGLITETDADNKYYGKTAGEGLYNYVHTELDREITDLHNKDLEIDSFISDVSSRLNNVKDVVDSIPENYQLKLVSGTNIKKINGEDILGEGNIIIQGGPDHVNITLAEWEALSAEEKLADIVYFITDAENEYARASDVQTVSDKVSNIEADYVKHEELPIVPDYTDKFNEIDTNIGVLQSGVQNNTDNISNLDSKTNNIETDYKAADKVLDEKIGANTREINNVSGRVSTIENDYVKHDDIKGFITEKDLPDYNPKFTEINSSISDVSGRVKTIEDDYVKYNDIKDFITLELLPDYNPKFNEINSSISDVSTRVKNIENDYLTSKDKITDYVKLSDYNTKVSEINSSISDVSNRVKNIEDVGLPTRMTVDMSNINAAGELKVKDIIRTEGYITEIPDSYATKNELNSSLANVSSWVSDNYAKKTSLDSYLLKTDAQNTYATTGQVSGLNDRVDELDLHITDVYTYYNPKLTEINSSISDVSSRLAGIVIPTDYVHTDIYEANLQEQKNVNTNVSQKLLTIDSSVNNLDNSVSLHSLDIQGLKGNIDVINSSIDDLGGRIYTLENANYATENYVNGLISDLHISDYLKSSDATNTYLKIENLPDYSSKFNEIDSSISNVSTRVKTVENKFDDYVLSSYIEGRISDISSAISSGDYDTLTNANKYTDDEIKKLPNYSVKISEIDSSISDVSSRINTLENSNFLTKTLADTYYVNSSDYNTDKSAQEQTNNTLSQDIIRLDGYFVKTNTSIGILNTSVNLLETNKLENLTPGTIVKIEGGMDLLFIADLTDAESNKARAILINQGETYYYELISGSGHGIWVLGDTDAPSVDLSKSTKFTWNKSSFNTGSGDVEAWSDVIVQRNWDSNSVGKLYKYLGEHPGSETTLGDYINSKIDTKIGDINTILENI